MLSRKRRLPKAFFEKNLLSKGSFLDSTSFSFKFGNLPAGETRFACVVSKKTTSLAVKRNRIRRACYNILSELYLELRPGLYGLFFLKKEGVNTSHSSLKKEIETTLKKAGILS